MVFVLDLPAEIAPGVKAVHAPAGQGLDQHLEVPRAVGADHPLIGGLDHIIVAMNAAVHDHAACAAHPVAGKVLMPHLNPAVVQRRGALSPHRVFGAHAVTVGIHIHHIDPAHRAARRARWQSV